VFICRAGLCRVGSAWIDYTFDVQEELE
jgi:hypothetical protein